MIFQLTFLCIFIGLCILGFHAVTRPGMLLSFLGQQTREEQELTNIEVELIEDKLETLNTYLEDVSNILASNNKNDRFDIIELSEKFLNTMDDRDERFDIETLEIEEEFEKKRSSFFRRILRPIASPFSECTTCMASIWSIVILSAYFINQYAVIIFVPLAVAGLIQIYEAFKSLQKIANKEISIEINDNRQ